MLKRIFVALALSVLAVVANAQSVLLPGTLTTADPVFRRTIEFAQGGVCALSNVGTAAHYRFHKFTLSAASNVVISLVPADGASIIPAAADTVIILYDTGGFTDVNACTRAIAANDDAVGHLSRIVTTTPLAVGTYTIVVTSFDNTPPDPIALPWDYSVMVTGAGVVQPKTSLPGTLTTSDPTFRRPTPFAQGGACILTGVATATHYRTHTVSLSSPSNLSVSSVPSDGAVINPATADTVLALYPEGGFDPLNACTNAIAANDDAVGSLSRIATNSPLAAGNYTVVMTSFSNVPSSPGVLPWTYSIRASGPGVVQPIALLPGTLTVGEPIFNRSIAFAQGAACSLSAAGTMVHYQTHALTLNAPSTLFLSLLSSDGASFVPAGADTFMMLYGPGAFNPLSPCTNAVAANDDGEGIGPSRVFTPTPLAAGNYTIVVTSFDNLPSGSGALPWTYSVFASGPGLGAPPALAGVASRKTHGAGIFDLPLP